MYLHSLDSTYLQIAKGDVTGVTATELLQLDELKGSDPVVAYKIGERSGFVRRLLMM
jgi:hypothetical protein